MAILQEDVYYWNICLTGNLVLLLSMPYRRAYCTGVRVILENIFYERTGFTGKYILLEVTHKDMSYRKHVL